MTKRLISVFTIASFLACFLGCVTITGPSVSREEIKKAQEDLKIKALAFRIKQLQRVNNIAHRLMLAISPQDIKSPPQAFLGIICAPLSKDLKQLYGLNVDKGVVVIGVKEKSPAQKYGLEPGDVLLSINKFSIRHIDHFKRATSNLKIGELVPIEILRGNKILAVEVKVGQIPVDIPIVIVDAQEVNAATNGREIYVTYGLLNFAKSDDEIAAVLGHELAHAVRGHTIKRQGWEVLSLITALTLGIVAESHSPGSGDIVMRSAEQISNVFNAGYSRDLEREADYFGIKFVYHAGYDVEVCATFYERFAIEIPASLTQNYFSTHPSSPERMLRIKKTIEKLKALSPPKSLNQD